MTMKLISRSSLVLGMWLVGWALLAGGVGRLMAAEGVTDEAELIRVLQSDAAPAEKAITCKRLAVYGSKNAVPALAALLADPDLSSWARIALEVIPGAAADEALREALGRLEGRVLIGVINSIGVRRDVGAVQGLARRLGDADAGVAAAAAEALGEVGGDAAASLLSKALGSTSVGKAGLRSSLALGCVLCAEHYMESGESAKAVRLYDLVRGADGVPLQRVLEATRGAILARGAGGLPLLLEQLRSSDREMVGIGLRTARELPGAEITKALAGELERAPAERQAPLLLAIADRRDEAVRSTVLAVAQGGTDALRIVAVQQLDRLGDVSCVPVLLEAAAAGEVELAKAAKLTLGRLEGKAVDEALLGRLPASSGSMRQVLLELAGQRRIAGALPVAMQSLGSTEPAVRKAAMEALGALGGEAQTTELVSLLGRTEVRREQADLERTLLMIAGRVGRSVVPQLSVLLESKSANLRMAGMRLLASVGGPQALSGVLGRLEDSEENVRDEAVRTLSAWPGNWPQDGGVAVPLMDLARTGKKPSYQIQGVRGYLEYVRNSHDLSAAEKMGKVREIWPLVQRPEERRLLIAVLGAVPNADSLSMLVMLAEDAAVAEEACLGMVNLAGKETLEGSTAEQRRQALEKVLATSKENRTKRRAQEALKLMQ